MWKNFLWENARFSDTKLTCGHLHTKNAVNFIPWLMIDGESLVIIFLHI